MVLLAACGTLYSVDSATSALYGGLAVLAPNVWFVLATRSTGNGRQLAIRIWIRYIATFAAIGMAIVHSAHPTVALLATAVMSITHVVFAGLTTVFIAAHAPTR